MTWNFRKFAAKVAEIVGSPYSFGLALLMILVWAAIGPRFEWSNGHQLFINTMTTIVTFLIVFLIQNTQNRDTKALHLKIDELLKATRGARNSMIDLDRLSDRQLKRLEAEFKRICTGDPVTDAKDDGAATKRDFKSRRR
jgi:low affinity Fe/Cu permease